MLQKLRSRHPIDIPAEDWGRKKGIAFVLGSLLVLFVVIPLLLSPIAGVLRIDGGARAVVVAIAAGLAALFLVLLVGGLRGKPGWDR